MRAKLLRWPIFVGALAIAVSGTITSGPATPAYAASSEAVEVATDPVETAEPVEIAPDAPADSVPTDSPALTESDADAFGGTVVAPAVGDGQRQVAAAYLSSFKAGQIISDANFYNGWAMTASEVQGFLDGRNPSACGTTCLETYVYSTPNRAANAFCQPYKGMNNERASAIIAKVGQACGISQEVLLVLLQKEQSLVSARNPTDRSYAAATGFGCPDTADCDQSRAGFFDQVYYAAYQFRNYGSSSWKQNYPVGKTVNVRYNPNASCGSAPVKITNKATSALYTYTPYQPNRAALANPYGEGDGCSAYGNRNFYTIYSGWFGDPLGAPAVAVDRVSGQERYSTSVAISKSTYSGTKVPVVYIATGESFPDSLSAASAAATQGGPLLLTLPNRVPDSVLKELQRLKPQRIVIVGGTAAVSSAVFDRLKKLVGDTTRVAGKDRFETSRLLAQKVFPNVTSAYVATGNNFPDALSAGAAAGTKRIPVVLVNGGASSVDSATSAYLKRMDTITVVGGPAAVSDKYLSSLKPLATVTRQSGATRYLTSIAINNAAFPKAGRAYVATGNSFPDALAGAAVAGATNSPLYVSPPECLPWGTRDSINSRGVDRVSLIGGTSALSSRVATLQPC